VQIVRLFPGATSKRTASSDDTCLLSNPTSADTSDGRDGFHKTSSIRPKSFLREEMDEFDRIFSELLKFSPQKRISKYLTTVDDEVEEIGGNKTDLTKECVHCADTNVNMECAQCKGVFGARSFDRSASCDDKCHSSLPVRGDDDDCCKCPPCRCEPSVMGGQSHVSGLIKEDHCAENASAAIERDRNQKLEARHKSLWDENDRLFFQLLDDLDNLTGDTASARRRKKAREMFSNWLFSEDPRSPDHPVKKYKDAFRDMARSQSFEAPECKAALFSKWRPRSFEYLSEVSYTTNG